MWTLYDVPFASRFLLGTALYPSPHVMRESIQASGAQIVTLSLRREGAKERTGQRFWSLIQDLPVRILPNTAGCFSAQEAITTAQMAREIFQTNWIKLEVIGDSDLLHPDVFGLLEAARVLCQEGFHVFPYTTEDCSVAEKLLTAGCRVLMPWGAPIGSGKGLQNPSALRALRARFPEIPLIIDAGMGLPSHAAQAMELGFDGVLLNTAVAKAKDCVGMAKAFRSALEAGRAAYEAIPMEPREMAAPSTPMLGLAFQMD